MVQPLHADLLAGTFAHGLLDEVAGFIGEQTVDPAHKLILRLAAELWLTVKGPAEQPVRVLYCNDTTGHNATGEGITLTDVSDIRNNLLVQSCHGCAHPICLLRVKAEFVRMTEVGALCSNLAPHIPAATFPDSGIKGGRSCLRAKSGILNTAAIGDKDKIILGEVNIPCLALSQ